MAALSRRHGQARDGPVVVPGAGVTVHDGAVSVPSMDAPARSTTEPVAVGDDAVTAALVAAYPSLRRFAAVVAPWDVPPDDVVHDAIVAVLRGDRLASVDDVGAYVRRAIVHRFANERRRLGRARRALARVGPQEHAVDAYPSDLAHLAALGAHARAVLYLHYVEGRSFEELALLLGRTPAAIRQTAARARRRLRAEEDR